MIGGAVSTVHVSVRDAVPTLPQASVALHVLVKEREHPVLPTAPSDAVGVKLPLQLSDAVAPPRHHITQSIVTLHPNAVDDVAVGVITGFVMSNVQVTVRDVVAVLPQPSVAVHFLVCALAQPVPPTEPSDTFGVSTPLQLSVAVAPPSALLISAEDGLHPSDADAVDVAVTVGAV